MFGTDASRFDLLEGVDIDFLEVLIFLAPAALFVEFAPAGDDLGVNGLGALFDGGIYGKEGFLGVEDLFDPGAEFRPGFAGEVETGAEVQQGVLADFPAGSYGLDEAVGEIGATAAAGSRLCLTNEHEPEDCRGNGF